MCGVSRTTRPAGDEQRLSRPDLAGCSSTRCSWVSLHALRSIISRRPNAELARVLSAPFDCQSVTMRRLLSLVSVAEVARPQPESQCCRFYQLP